MFSQSLHTFPRGVETRWATAENPEGARSAGGQANWGRKGSPSIRLAAGEECVLAESKGRSGMVRRIWMTLSDRSPTVLRGLRLDFYWDGARRAAVSAPLADFFSVCPSRLVPFQSALFSSPEGRSLNSVVPMPFRSGFKIVAVNETDEDVQSLFYEVNYTLGDMHERDMLYFHAHFGRENPTSLRKDYELLPEVTGAGRFLGVSCNVRINHDQYATTWWGEGEVKCYVDGDSTYPTLVGTGTEDYIGTGWGQGAFSHLYQGSPVADPKRGLYSFYRLHVADPVIFNSSIRVTVQQIGFVRVGSVNYGPLLATVRAKGHRIMAAGREGEPFNLDEGGLFERQDDWSSCAYFYLDRPVNDLPPCPDVGSRLANL